MDFMILCSLTLIGITQKILTEIGEKLGGLTHDQSIRC